MVGKLIIWLTLLGCVLSDSGGQWSYSGADGPSSWGTNFPTCAAATNPRQSPVELKPATYEKFQNPVLGSAYSSQQTVSVVNSGKTVKFTFTKNQDLSVTVTMNGASKKFLLDSGHLHWGVAGAGGAEHLVDGVRHTAELHLVHYDSQYGSLSDTVSAGSTDSLLVLGVFLQAAGGDFKAGSHSALTNFINSFSSVVAKDATTSSNITPSEFIPTESSVFNYPGGLTTPTCNGIVQFYIYAQPIVLDANTFGKLYALQDGNSAAIQNNYRPVQGIGTRVIRTNTANTNRGPITFLMMSLLVALFTRSLL